MLRVHWNLASFWLILIAGSVVFGVAIWKSAEALDQELLLRKQEWFRQCMVLNHQDKLECLYQWNLQKKD